jgi:adenylate cyclase
VEKQQAGDSAPSLMRPFHLDDCRVDPAAGLISRNDERIHLEPRVMTVLTVLAGRAGEVLSREQLEAEAWAGTVVGYDALASSILKLRKALGDSTRQPRYIETVSKRGYRLVAPVSFDEPSSSGTATTPSSPASGSRSWKVGAVAAFVLVAIVVATLVLMKHGDVGDTETGANLKTLAVMPFTNISNNPENEYFVEGITDDIMTNLSGLSDVLVVSRSATYRYKGQDFEPKDVGQELGADYLVEGSIRKSGKRWRINASLIETSTGVQLWAKKFESRESSLFKAQDELTNSIVSSLALQLTSNDKRRLQYQATTNFEAYDLFLHGQKLFKERTREANEAAQEAYRKAIKLDPDFARAHSALAVALTVEFWRNWSDNPTETLDRALEMANLSVRLNPASPQAYWARGYALMYQKKHNLAIKAVKRAISIAPTYADGYGLLALMNNQLGNGDKAARLIKKGMKLDPHYSWDYPYILGRAYYVMGKYEDAIKTLGIALKRNEQAVNPRLFLAASYVSLGRMDDARWEVEQIRIMNPGTTLSHLEKDYPIADKALQKRFLDQLRKAGLPEA